MNNSHQRILEDIVRLLRDEVVSAIDDRNLRAQVYSAVYMLENLRLRIDWAREPALAQLQAQETLFDALRALGIASVAALPRLDSRGSGAELIALRDERDARIAELIERDAIPPAAMAQLHDCLRRQAEAEMRHTARAMFAEMASGDPAAP